jgi:tRNA G18 (ribose-2'-O)-methylase SpoU
LSGPIPVEHPADPRLADFVGLRDSRTPEPVLIAEGLLALERLVRSPYPVRSVLVLGKRWPRVAPLVAGARFPVYVAPDDVMRATTGYDLHRGVLASADRLPPTDASTLLAAGRLVAILEGLNDHENLGVLFRNAAAFGVDAVLLDPTCADPLYRRTVRVSLGHVLHVPFARVDPWPDCLNRVRNAGFTTVALTPDRAAESIERVGAERLDRVALLLGAEGPGLTPAILKAADRRVRIPMAPGVDSLNVAAAAAIAFHRFGAVPD